MLHFLSCCKCASFFFISFPFRHFSFERIWQARRCVYFIGFHYSQNNSPTFKKGEGKYRSILYQKPIKLLLRSDSATVLSNIKSRAMCRSIHPFFVLTGFSKWLRQQYLVWEQRLDVKNAKELKDLYSRSMNNDPFYTKHHLCCSEAPLSPQLHPSLPSPPSHQLITLFSSHNNTDILEDRAAPYGRIMANNQCYWFTSHWKTGGGGYHSPNTTLATTKIAAKFLKIRTLFATWPTVLIRTWASVPQSNYWCYLVLRYWNGEYVTRCQLVKPINNG